MQHAVALIGNPNVGKSTVFNAMTGMNQHTGNWTGKTVESAKGDFWQSGEKVCVVDLPGTYSLFAHSKEEEVTKDYLMSGECAGVMIVCDASCLERNLNLVYQTLELGLPCAVCLNLMDEAEKKGIRPDIKKLEEALGVPVLPCCAKKNRGIAEIKKAMLSLKKPKKKFSFDGAADIYALAERTVKSCVVFEKENYDERDRRIDRLLTGKKTGIPIMLALLLGVFWLTLSGANYPSAGLQTLFGGAEDALKAALISAGASAGTISFLIDGVFSVTAAVVAVMLPPMAIFFPLFTILEDIGYLPRAAFCLDKAFSRVCACGKQALTTCMGFGCNAAGVTSCRIIHSKRERLIAVITNAFIPCNGKLPALITIISVFSLSAGMGENAFLNAGLLVLTVALGVIISLFASWLLAKTVLSGMPSLFTMELPPYRGAKIASIAVRSLKDRTLFVLLRALTVAAPAGAVIWALSNIYSGGESLLDMFCSFLDPFGRAIGLDGVMIAAFILGFPANEIVLPIALMAYTASSALPGTDGIFGILAQNGWTEVTALCALTFCLVHWPCSTTLITIAKETKSAKWTFLSFALPTAMGIALCFCINTVYSFFM